MKIEENIFFREFRNSATNPITNVKNVSKIE